MEQSVIDKNLTVKQGADEIGSTSISDKWINVGGAKRRKRELSVRIQAHAHWCLNEREKLNKI